MISTLIGLVLSCFFVSNQRVSEVSCDSYFRFGDSVYCITKFDEYSIIRCMEIGEVGFVKKHEFKCSHPEPVAVHLSDQFIYVVYRYGTFERRKLLSPSEVQSRGKIEIKGRINIATLTPVLPKFGEGIEEGTYFVQLGINSGNDIKFRLLKATLSDGNKFEVSWEKECQSFPMLGYSGVFLGTGARGSDFIEWLEIDTGKVVSKLEVLNLSYFYFLDEKTLLTRNKNSFEFWEANAGNYKSREKLLVPRDSKLFGNQIAVQAEGVFSIASIDDKLFKKYPQVPIGDNQILRVIGDIVFLRSPDSSIQAWDFKKGNLLYEEKMFDIQPIGSNRLLVVKKPDDSPYLLSIKELNEP